MDKLADYSINALFILSVIAGFFSFGFAIYYNFRASKGMNKERRLLPMLIPPIGLFMPSLYTEEGEKYRAKSMRAMGAFLLLWLITMMVGHLL